MSEPNDASDFGEAQNLEENFVSSFADINADQSAEWTEDQSSGSLSPTTTAIAAEAVLSNTIHEDSSTYNDAENTQTTPEPSSDVLTLEASPFAEYYRRDTQREAEEAAAWERIGSKHRESAKLNDDEDCVSEVPGEFHEEEESDQEEEAEAKEDSGELPAALAWKQQKEQSLLEKEELEKLTKQKLLDEGKKSIERFYEDYNKKKARAKLSNDAREADLLAEIDRLTQACRLSDMNGAELSSNVQPPSYIADWEKVVNMIDLNPKNKPTRDVTRMKELILRLKNEFISAREVMGK